VLGKGFVAEKSSPPAGGLILSDKTL